MALSRLVALHRLLALIVVAALLAMAILLGGCSRSGTDETLQADAVKHDGMTAEQYLGSVFARYRSAESYRDEGQVRLSYHVGDQVKSEVAPLRLWFDRNVLYLDAYDVHLRHTPDRFTAWITDPTSDNFDSQVVRTAASPGRPSIDNLLSDTVLRERVVAGLAGPPPQLDWLFAAKPMERLFDGPYQIRFGKSVTVDQQDCLTVVVLADDEVYRFAVDRRRGVIRRVQLPSILAPVRFQTNGMENSSAGSPSQAIRLTLELDGATFESPTEQPALAQLPRLPRFVSHFIPLPPDEPSRILQTRIGRFNVRDQSGRVTLTHHGFDVDYTVMLFSDNHPSQMASAANLIQWVAVMPSSVRHRIGVALLVNEEAFRLLPRDCPLPLFVDDGEIRKTVSVEQGDLVIVNRDAQVVWFQKGVTPESIVQLGRIVGDLLDGVDVPARLQSQWQSDSRTYQAVRDAEVSRHSRE
jgi:hypothetical protein